MTSENPLPPVPADDHLPPDSVLFGKSKSMQGLRSRMEKVAPTDVPVLIQGASGSGKEVVARWLHAHSERRDRPFVKVHCPAIPDMLLESDLFGHETGAFTGAVKEKPGRIENADGGTLFLDEIADIDPGLQAKLLQVLQDGYIHRLGGESGRRLDIRLICATNRRLDEEIAAGHFRSDLYYRISVVRLDLPPLRERAGDVSELAHYLVKVYNSRYHQSRPLLTSAALQLLAAHDWPGNIREIENLISRYVIFGSERIIEADLFPGGINPGDKTGTEVSLRRVAKDAALEAERRLLLRILHTYHWNRRKTAQALHISYRGLLYKLRDTGISPPRAPSKAPISAAGGAH